MQNYFSVNHCILYWIKNMLLIVLWVTQKFILLWIVTRFNSIVNNSIDPASWSITQLSLHLAVGCWLSKTCFTELPPFKWSKLDIPYRSIWFVHRLYGKHHRNCMYDFYYSLLILMVENQDIFITIILWIVGHEMHWLGDQPQTLR